MLLIDKDNNSAIAVGMLCNIKQRQNGRTACRVVGAIGTRNRNKHKAEQTERPV